MKTKSNPTNSRGKNKKRIEKRPRRIRVMRLRWPDRPETWGISLLFLAAITLALLLLEGGVLVDGWRGLFGLVFGWGMYFAPVLLAIFGIELTWQGFDKKYQTPSGRWSGWLVLYGVTLGFIQRFTHNPQPGDLGNRGGGYVGFLVYQTLANAVGDGGAILALLALLALGCALVLGVSLQEIKAASRNIGQALSSGWRWVTDLRLSFESEDPSPEEIVRPASVARREDEEPPRQILVRAPSLSSSGAASHPVPKSEAGDAVSPASVSITPGQWTLPPLTLLKLSSPGEVSASDIRHKVKIIESTLNDFDVPARVVEVNQGPTVTQFGLEPGFREKRDRTGAIVRRDKIKVSEITGLANDLALALAAATIRIEAPVPGRNVIGVEVPNSTTSVVMLRDLLETAPFQRLRAKSRLAIALGQDVSGQSVVADLARMPHLLIAGSTGSGKSVCINSIIACLILHSTPAELRLLMIDPKRVELSGFNDIPHLLRPVVVEVEKVVGVLKWVVHEMEERYKKFELAGVRNIDGYNRLCAARGGRDPLPYIVLLIDELADLMMTAPDEVEKSVCRLAQLARATGIHLVIATQRPSVDVITGLIKANFPTRVSFAVTSQVDSRTILDMPGAEKLLGRGDMLFMPTDAAKPVRLQGVFVSDDEIEALVGFWKAQGSARYVDELLHVPKWSADSEDQGDELYDKAVEIAQQYNRMSASLLQRKLRIGYARAARLIDLLEENGVVGGGDFGHSRESLANQEAQTYDEETAPTS